MSATTESYNDKLKNGMAEIYKQIRVDPKTAFQNRAGDYNMLGKDSAETQQIVKMHPYNAESTKSFEGLSEQLMPKINPVNIPKPKFEYQKPKSKNVEVVLLQFEDPSKAKKKVKVSKVEFPKENRRMNVSEVRPKNKLIVWDKRNRQWISSEQAPISEFNSKDQRASSSVLKITENIQAPLQRIDSFGSDDAYNMYPAEYKRMPHSQEGLRNQDTYFLNKDLHEANSEKELKGTLPQSQPTLSETNTQKILDPELTEAYLHDLVQRVHQLPVTDNRRYIGKSVRQESRFRNRSRLQADQ